MGMLRACLPSCAGLRFVLYVMRYPSRASMSSAVKSAARRSGRRRVDAGEQLMFWRCGSENQRRRAARGRAQPRWRASAFGGVAGHAPGRAHRPLAPIGGLKPARPRARKGWWPTGVFVTAALYLSRLAEGRANRAPPACSSHSLFDTQSFGPHIAGDIALSWGFTQPMKGTTDIAVQRSYTDWHPFN